MSAATLPPDELLTEEETAAALETARELIRAGVPIFLAKPDPTAESGYTPPPKWDAAIPLLDVINRWRPGWALCAVGGHVCDFLDVDPRNGGDVDEAGLRNAGIWPTSYGRATTPSGGTHDIITPLRIGKGKVTPGIDLQGGLPEPDDEGKTHRGFVFIAPTVRVSKVDGARRAYRWVIEPAMDVITEEADTDDSGDEIATIVAEYGKKPRSEPGANTRQKTEAPPDPVGLLHTHVTAFETLTTEGNNRTQQLDNLAMLAGHGVPTYWTADAARTRLLEAALANGFIRAHGQRAALTQINSGLTDGAQEPWATPDPSERAYHNEVAHELRRLKIRDEARRLFVAESEIPPDLETTRLVPGGSFIHDSPTQIPAIWGRGEEILWSEGEPLLITGPTGVGKALRNDQPVLTPTGWIPIGKLCVGDNVIGSSGLPVPVTGVYPQGVRELFEVTTSDGITIVADKDHLWSTQTTTDRMNGHHNWVAETTIDIAETLTVHKAGRDRVNHYLPMLSAPILGPTISCPLDPWLIGVLIGDGSLTGSSVNLSNPDVLLLAQVRRVLPTGADLRARAAGGVEWRITTRRGTNNPVLDALRELSLQGCRSYDKTIPDFLLHASGAQRHALLQGLLDTDGSVYGFNTVEYSTASPYLAEQVPWLVHSMGGTVRVTRQLTPSYTYKGERRVGRPSWRIRMSLPPDILPFAHSAKAARYTPRSKYPPRRQIVSITRVEDGLATCISVDTPDKLYVTTGCVLTHNTTIGGQVIAGRLGLIPTVLGYPVTPGRKVLYLAMDRPVQIARALGRLLRQYPRELLDERLAVWRGPPPSDLAAHPQVLLDLAQQANADTVVLDSLKDAAVKLSDEEVGQGLNRALQLCVANGIEIIGYHHQTKRGGGSDNKPNSLADVYGSAWITAGVGSVLLLWGNAGDPVIELSHLKQPAGEVGPLQLNHDTTAGTMNIVEGEDTLDLLLAAPRTPTEVAAALYGVQNPTRAQKEKARRKIQKLVDRGLAVQLTDASTGGARDAGKGGGDGARYGAAHRTIGARRSTVSEFPQVDRGTDRNTENRGTGSVHEGSTTVHEKDITAGQSVHASVHAQEEPLRSTPSPGPPLRGAEGVKRGDHETGPHATGLDASDDRWVHTHLTTRPQTIARLATDLDATTTTLETALTRLESIGHAQRHPRPGQPDGWSLPTREENQ